MEHRKIFSVGCILAFLSILFFYAQAAYADKLADWEKLVQFNGSYAPFRSASAATHDAKFVSEWKKWHDEFTPFSQKFKKKYGATQEALTKSFDGLDAPDGVYVRPAHLLDLLTLDTDAQQKVIAGWLKKEGDEIYGRWEALKNPSKEKLELRADYAKRALNKYVSAEELSPGVADAAKAKAKKAVKESDALFKEAMENIKWPGHNPDFRGPGDPDVLAAEALQLLLKMKKEGKQWSKPEYDDEHIPVAACVSGSKWEVYKKEPLTQKPTQYSMKIFVAFKGTLDPDIAYGYHMFFYTDEKSGVKMAPPFYYCNSQQYAKFKMLMDNVPGGGSGAGATSAGGMAIVLRLLLAFLLVACGIAVWEAFFRDKLPQLSSLYDMLSGKKEILGYALMAVAVFSLFRTVFFLFSPLADLLPQLVALALGLTLVSVENVAQRSKNEKMQIGLSWLEKVKNSLKPHQVLLGQIAVALGIVHLVLGCVTFI